MSDLPPDLFDEVPRGFDSDDPEWFVELVDGGLDRARERDLRSRLARDSELTRRYEAYAAMVAVLRAGGRSVAAEDGGVELGTRILAAVTGAPALRAATRPRFVPWLAAGGLAAAALLVFFIGFRGQRSRPDAPGRLRDLKAAMPAEDRGEYEEEQEQSVRDFDTTVGKSGGKSVGKSGGIAREAKEVVVDREGRDAEADKLADSVRGFVRRGALAKAPAKELAKELAKATGGKARHAQKRASNKNPGAPSAPAAGAPSSPGAGQSLGMLKQQDSFAFGRGRRSANAPVSLLVLDINLSDARRVDVPLRNLTQQRYRIGLGAANAPAPQAKDDYGLAFKSLGLDRAASTLIRFEGRRKEVAAALAALKPLGGKVVTVPRNFVARVQSNRPVRREELARRTRKKKPKSAARRQPAAKPADWTEIYLLLRNRTAPAQKQKR